MKRALKISLIVVVTLIALYFITGFIYMEITEYNRTKNLNLDGDAIIITEDEYINYISELYINTKKYVGKEVVIEGVFDTEEYDGITYNFVGKELKIDEDENHEHSEECEETHYIGLEFIYDGDKMPELGSYIQVKGKVALVADEQKTEIEYLTLTNCEIKTDVPVGQEYVK